MSAVDHQPPPTTMVQGATQVATGAIAALGSSPAMLMLILLVAIVFGLTAWSIQKNQDRQQAILELLLDRCLPTAPPGAHATGWTVGHGPRSTDWWLPVKGTKP